MNKQIIKGILFFCSLLILSRLIPHPPNFTPLIAGAIFLPFLIKDKWLIILLPIFCLLISDFFLGFHTLMIWTYSAFLIIGIIAYSSSVCNLGLIIGQSLFSSTLFFLLTNFGVWLGSSIYTQDADGLLLCYFLALPFYSSTLLSTLIFSSLFYVSYNFIIQKRLNIFKNV